MLLMASVCINFMFACPKSSCVECVMQLPEAQVKFVYQGHRVKVKVRVTAAKKAQNASCPSLIENQFCYD